jgi:hypothetical protein
VTARTVAVALASAILLFGLVTLAALEANEVVVLRTVDADGRPRDTRTWVADDGGFAWIEAVNPERPFLRHLRTHPEVEMRRAGGIRRCRAESMPNPEGHARIRELLARRYGWADCWIGMLTDTSRSVAVRLSCG